MRGLGLRSCTFGAFGCGAGVAFHAAQGFEVGARTETKPMTYLYVGIVVICLFGS